MKQSLTNNLRSCFWYVVLGFVLTRPSAKAFENETVNDIKYQRSFFTLYSDYPVGSPALFVAKDEKGFYRVQKLLSPLLGGTKSPTMDVPHLFQTVKPDFSKETTFFIFGKKFYLISSDIDGCQHNKKS